MKLIEYYKHFFRPQETLVDENIIGRLVYLKDRFLLTRNNIREENVYTLK